MSLDQRQAQIEVDKGLTESRLNQDFIDFLRKYGSAILLVVCAVSLAYVGWNWYQKKRDRSADEAWLSLEKAMEARNPDGLLAVASEHAGEPGIPLLARTEAGDIWLQAAIMGVVPGAEIAPDGKVSNADDLLTPEGVTRQLDRAAEQYRAVLAASTGKAPYALHEIRALFGLAAVEETKGQYDDAKRRYEQIIAAANKAELPGLAGAAKKLLDTIEDAKSAPRLYADGQVVTKPPPAPAPSANSPFPGLPGALTPVNPADLPPGLLNPQPATTNTNPDQQPKPAPTPKPATPSEPAPSAPAPPAESPAANPPATPPASPPADQPKP